MHGWYDAQGNYRTATYYHCERTEAGLRGYCYTRWHDDDPDNNPFDPGAQIESVSCTGDAGGAGGDTAMPQLVRTS